MKSMGPGFGGCSRFSALGLRVFLVVSGWDVTPYTHMPPITIPMKDCQYKGEHPKFKGTKKGPPHKLHELSS